MPPSSALVSCAELAYTDTHQIVTAVCMNFDAFQTVEFVDQGIHYTFLHFACGIERQTCQPMIGVQRADEQRKHKHDLRNQSQTTYTIAGRFFSSCTICAPSPVRWRSMWRASIPSSRAHGSADGLDIDGNCVENVWFPSD
jgi:hypothetical protein